MGVIRAMLIRPNPHRMVMAFNHTVVSGGTAMAYRKVMAEGSAYESAQPSVVKIGLADLKDILAKGFADFKAVPTHLAFLCVIYPLVIIVFARFYAGFETLPLVFPLLFGYTLMGPLVAIGIYELSRRRERGLAVYRRHVFGVFKNPSIINTAVLGLVLMVIYFIWMGAAWKIYEMGFGGEAPESVVGFASQIFDTPKGSALTIFGSGVGFFFAVMVFSLSLVSFPMILDRNVSAMIAARTSLRVVLKNPITMAIWGLMVAGSLLIGALPFFVGLAVVLPVLGHASWHLYRKTVLYEEAWNEVNHRGLWT